MNKIETKSHLNVKKKQIPRIERELTLKTQNKTENN